MKEPSNYQDRAVQKNEQMPIDIKSSDSELVRPTIIMLIIQQMKPLLKKEQKK